MVPARYSEGSTQPHAAALFAASGLRIGNFPSHLDGLCRFENCERLISYFVQICDFFSNGCQPGFNIIGHE